MNTRNDILNNLIVSGTTSTSSLKITNGAIDGYVLKSDGDGNTSWQDGSFQEEVTHSELTTLISGSLLIIGKSYLITDYKTIYIQPDWSGISTSVSVSGSLIKEGLTEPLVVTAISTNQLSPIVISTTFPTDVIYYSPSVETLYTGYDTKGKIVRRVDFAGNDIPFDFRNVKFKVYPDLVYDGYRHYNNGNSPLEEYVFSNRDLQDNNYQSSVKGNVIKYSVNLDYDNGHSQYGIWGFNTTFYGDQILNNRINGFISNCCLVGGNEIIDIELNSVILQTYIQGNTRLSSSYFSGYLQRCNFVGGSITNNYFNSNLEDTKIDVSNFSLNNIQMNGINNIITGSSFKMNNIKSYVFSHFNCSSSMYNNNITCDQFGGSVGITSSVDLFSYNDINSTIFASFTFSSSFYKNKVSGSLYNIKAYGFLSNTFGTGFTIDGASFSGTENIISNNFISNNGNLSGNYSTASHIYSDYDCDVFLDFNLNLKLRYIDGSSNWVFTEMTE